MAILRRIRTEVEKLAMFIRPVPVPEKLRAALQAKQVSSINHLIVVMLLVGLLNTAIVLLELGSISLHPMMVFWGAALTLVNIIPMCITSGD